MKKPFTKEIAVKMLASNEESLKDLAVLHYPELRSIDSYEDALSLLGREAPCFEHIPPKVIALIKLATIVEAYNSKRDSVAKYFPWFTIDNNRQVQVLIGVDYYSSDAVVTAPALFKDQEDCREAGSKFINLYKEAYSC